MPLRSALMAFLLLPPLFGHGAPNPASKPTSPDHAVHRVGAWTVRTRTDRFTGRSACTLTRPQVRYERQALVLQLPARLDTSAAVYRIDDGPAVPAREDAMELARLGFALHDDDLANPSGGRVTVPVRRLVGAHTIRIEAKPRGAVYRFKVDGLASALDAASRMGCGPGDFTSEK
jgi:hypothetical protein